MVMVIWRCWGFHWLIWPAAFFFLNFNCIIIDVLCLPASFQNKICTFSKVMMIFRAFCFCVENRAVGLLGGVPILNICLCAQVGGSKWVENPRISPKITIIGSAPPAGSRHPAQLWPGTPRLVSFCARVLSALLQPVMEQLRLFAPFLLLYIVYHYSLHHFLFTLSRSDHALLVQLEAIQDAILSRSLVLLPLLISLPILFLFPCLYFPSCCTNSQLSFSYFFFGCLQGRRWAVPPPLPEQGPRDQLFHFFITFEIYDRLP